MKNTHKKTSIFALFFLLFVLNITTISAQAFFVFSSAEKANEPRLDLRAEVKDHINHEAIKGIKAELLNAADSSFVDTVKVEYVDMPEIKFKYSSIEARVTKPGNYLIKVEHEDYQTKYVPVEIKKLYKKERFKDLKTIYLHQKLKQNEYELGDVVIKATRLKFYMDGDTLVYDADAFSMAEGSMLSELLKKLPGVELESGGVIKVNGRQIDALLLNGKDFFNSDRELLLENMPSYMVKNIQTYERVPENVLGTNKETTTQKEHVMNVKLKKEYNEGWIANTEGGIGSSFFRNNDDELDTKYLARIFGLRFDDRSRLTLFFNTNNLNDSNGAYGDGEWSQLSQSRGLTTSYTAGSNWRIETGKRTGYEGSINGTYTDRLDESNTSSATFLETGDTYGRSMSSRRSYNWNLNTNHHYNFISREPIGNLFKYLNGSISPNISYQKWDNRNLSGSATFNEDVADNLGKEWVDSIMAPDASEVLLKYAINRNLSRSKGRGHSNSFSTSGNIALAPAHNDYIDFNINYSFSGTKYENKNYEHYRLDYPSSTTMPMDFRNRYTPTESRSRNFNIRPNMSVSLDQQMNNRIDFSYSYDYTYNNSNNPLYLLNKLAEWDNAELHPLGTLPSTDEVLATIDQYNSSHTKTINNRHTPEINYTLIKRKENSNKMSFLNLGLRLPMVHEMMDYQQGVRVDTVMRRYTAFLNPSISVYHSDYQKGRNINIGYSMNTSAPAMTSLLDIRDDANPLYITQGNPNLKNTRSHSIYSYYMDKFGKTMFNISVNVNITENAVASGFIYDKETGVRTVTPENVNGNWSLNSSTGIDVPLDSDDKWRLRNTVMYSFNNSVDLNGTNETMIATRSVVHNNTINDNLTLTWRPSSKMDYEVNGRFYYQHSSSNRANFVNQNVFTYQYGAKAQLELPWNMQVATNLTMYCRRGYSEHSMNTDELVWNLRVSKRLLKGRLTLMFDSFDLLGNLSNVQRSINAQGRTETYYNLIPSYGLFHAIWRFNKPPKNKKMNNE